MPRHKTFNDGDYFFVPLGDDGSPLGTEPDALGQVLSIEKTVLGGVPCAFWARANDDVIEQLKSQPIAVEVVTPDLLKSGRWAIQGNGPVFVPSAMRHYEAFRGTDWVGAKVRGSGNLRNLLRAFRGLEYWDDYADPTYLNSLLTSGTPVPSNAKFKPRS